ncbi:toll/interleukin-1 receptor domain-containing protein [Pseudaquabacterium pictum]|uniref:TIR domain-containing protein n=1 Tax=Pseudaquabacterium pictum TaxID=2315236 RepID=A0A480AUL1_9BURK|nr:toll/interleukin-1 receptor domain-containing protein [Rubrivivax pictus]GCL64570.1 hypothetical protein AQPW35_36510 [Rubrivivax pictus]
MNTAQAQIFLSYRRDDTAGYARALNDLLAQQFGAERVFIDVDDIGAGQAFDARITQAMGQARVLLVLIGPRWLAPQVDGVPRLHHDDDMVRREVQAGLDGGLQVIPLLFDGAAMPAEAQLPGPLQPLARRQALVMDPRRFAADSQQLLAVLQQTLGVAAAAPAPPPPGRRRAVRLLAGAAAATALAGAAWWALQPATHPPSSADPGTAALPARLAINGRWQAEVRYGWMASDLRETLDLQGEGTALQGTASFLRVPRGIEDGQVNGAEVRFTTRSSEVLGNGPERVVTHQYTGRLVGDTLQLTMQTTGAAQPHGPVAVVARRLPPP